jgi:Flp pilus assembly protein TadG
MFRKFRSDVRGNYATLLALAIVPIMGALALAIDYTELGRQRQATLNALDATNLATAWQVLQGKSDAEVLTYAQDFFKANLGPVKPENAVLHVTLPSKTAGGGTLEMKADLKYKPYFYPVFQLLQGNGGDGSLMLSFDVGNEVRLKNTLEVALVLDNSGSMSEKGFGSGQQRMTLLKAASKELVDTLAKQAGLIRQVQKPIQFGLVPFAASVNVGPDKRTASWMDTDGISPIHHENFNWDEMSTQLAVKPVNGVLQKTGTGWPSAERNQKVTRFTLFDDLKKRNSSISWGGCVEMRPYPYNVNNAPANRNNPVTLFVPMFAPDEPEVTTTDWLGRQTTTHSYNSWIPDVTTSTDTLVRQKFMPKYYASGSFTPAANKGPNLSCTTKPVTPLTDVTTATGLKLVKDAIDGMVANGATNVPEGLAWGWRIVSGSEPFTEGRPDHERGNDKVVIVLTDGANTYYTPSSLGFQDLAANRSIYSNYGYAKERRIFDGTNVNRNDFSNANYTRAMNQHLLQVCSNAKAAGIMVMTVALDLSSSKTDEREQIATLQECASESRSRKDPTNPAKNAKLFWNTTGADLSESFKQIADELSNLRITR